MMRMAAGNHEDSPGYRCFCIVFDERLKRDIINLIRVTKSEFGSKIPEIVKNYTKTVKGQINNTSLDQGYELIRKILKADYTSENDGNIIIPKNMRVAYSGFAAYKVEGNIKADTVESLLDEESHMIRISYIDEVSAMTNKELDCLLNMELGDDL